MDPSFQLQGFVKFTASIPGSRFADFKFLADKRRLNAFIGIRKEFPRGSRPQRIIIDHAAVHALGIVGRFRMAEHAKIIYYASVTVMLGGITYFGDDYVLAACLARACLHLLQTFSIIWTNTVSSIFELSPRITLLPSWNYKRSLIVR